MKDLRLLLILVAAAIIDAAQEKASQEKSELETAEETHSIPWHRPPLYFSGEDNHLHSGERDYQSQPPTQANGGIYHFEYQTEDGSRREETGIGGLSVQGSYAYISPDGTPVHVAYIADHNGFRPIGNVISEHVQRSYFPNMPSDFGNYVHRGGGRGRGDIKGEQEISHGHIPGPIQIQKGVQVGKGGDDSSGEIVFGKPQNHQQVSQTHQNHHPNHRELSHSPPQQKPFDHNHESFNRLPQSFSKPFFESKSNQKGISGTNDQARAIKHPSKFPKPLAESPHLTQAILKPPPPALFNQFDEEIPSNHHETFREPGFFNRLVHKGFETIKGWGRTIKGEDKKSTPEDINGLKDWSRAGKETTKNHKEDKIELPEEEDFIEDNNNASEEEEPKEEDLQNLTRIKRS